ncbi:hypothetical protein JXM83_02445, partial [Candidatus Woesearchaeota archaeon]|nr:hypothetical protein [Candidatus Woesearchaeota archaeon]
SCTEIKSNCFTKPGGDKILNGERKEQYRNFYKAKHGSQTRTSGALTHPKFRISKSTGMKPKSKLWKLIPQQNCGVLYPPISSGLFD